MKKDKKIRRELLDELLAGYLKPEDLDGARGAAQAADRRSGGASAGGRALLDHLGYVEHAVEGARLGQFTQWQRRQDASRTELGPVDIDVPRDREGTFEPQLVQEAPTTLRRLRRQQILALYARGHERARHPGARRRAVRRRHRTEPRDERDRGGACRECNPWQARPLEPVWPIVYLDALMIKVRGATAASSATRRRIWRWASIPRGKKEVLGLWLQQTERGEVLAHRRQRAEKSRRRRHLHRVLRRTQRLPRGHRGGLPARHRTNVASCTPDPKLGALRRLGAA